MPIIQTADLRQGQAIQDQQQVYNGLDCCLTVEILEALQSLHNELPIAYDFERALQGPVLDMMLRGFLVDEVERQGAISTLKAEVSDLLQTLTRFSVAVWDKPLNPRSQPQLQEFFYKKMHLPEQWASKKGERKLSMDREALEKLEVYFHARPIVAVILAIRDKQKQIEILETEVDPDSRMRCSYNVAGTTTGRFSSSSNAFGTGGNLQNVPPALRRVFIADPGYKLCVMDLEQAESREVGWQLWLLFNDPSYLDACESGDLHTYVAKLIWPDLRAQSDLFDQAGKLLVTKGTGFGQGPKADRAIVDQIFYRDFTYRDMSKRAGHATAYNGTPFTIARVLRVPIALIETFQRALFKAFPSLRFWHAWIAQQIQTTHSLTTPFGRTRHFFGRPNDDTTLREAIAFIPQSSTADRTNLALWRIWHHIPQVQILAQTHDSVTFQYKEEDELWAVPKARELMRVELAHNGRSFVIENEAKIGWCWSNAHDESRPCDGHNRYNPLGLRKWRGVGQDQRTRN